MYLLGVFVTLLFVDVTTSQASFECNSLPNTDCTCTEGRTAKDFEFRCPIMNTKIITKLQVNSLISLNCQDTQDFLTYLPRFPGPLGVDALMFEECKLPEKSTLQKISTYFGTSNIKKLRITYSQISNISRLYFRGFENLEVLYLQQNNLRDVPRDLIYDLKNLTDLDLRGNTIKLSPDFFQRTLNLRKLELGENEMVSVPDGLFANLSSLLVLNMWSNNLTEISEAAFGDLINLHSLDLRTNHLVTLPPNIFEKLAALRLLSLRTNKFRSLPAGLFTNNKNLTSVQLDNNIELNDLPKFFFGNLTNLTIVSLERCNLSALHEGLFWGTPNLKDLTLKMNALTTLPPLIFKDTTLLETLQLEQNLITFLPDNIFRNLTKLIMLSLQNNKLLLRDGTLYGLDALQRLNLQNNGLVSLPARMMRQIPEIRVINLSDNKLNFTNISSPFSDSTKLEEIYLKNNEIDQIFYDWKLNLGNLTILDLSRNKFVGISYNDLHFTQKNIRIDLSYNQIKSIDMQKAEFEVSANNVDARSNNEYYVRVNVEGNTLDCDCLLYDLIRYYDGTMDPRVRATLELESKNLVCSDGQGLYSIEQMNSKTFSCSVPNDEYIHACPDTADCRYRQFDNMYIVNASYRGLEEVPVIGEHEVEKVEVHLQGNSLRAMPKPNMGYEKARRLYISHNKITDVRWIPPNLTILELHNNNLTRLSIHALNLLNATALTNVTLYNNPWDCDCDAINFTKYLQVNFRKVDDLHKITCANNKKYLTDLSENDLCPYAATLTIVLSATLAVVSMIACLLVAFYYKYNHQIKVWLYVHGILPSCCREQLDKEKLYDAFISYSHQDEAFVLDNIVKWLETGPNSFRLCLHFRDWEPGEYITENIAKSVENSCRTMVVVSPNFLKSEWGKMEFRTAHTQALRDKANRVIVILYGDIGKIDDLDPELKVYLQTNTYIKWGQPWFWNNLLYAMPHRAKYIKDKIINDKIDLMAPATPIATTPPADSMHMDPMKDTRFGALNVSLINGSLVNNNVMKDQKYDHIV